MCFTRLTPVQPPTIDKICDLAQLVAELACLCDSIPPDLFGALVAICLPFDASYDFLQLVMETSMNVSVWCLLQAAV